MEGQPLLHLSSVAPSPLVDRAGEKLGRVEDVIVRLADGGFPPVTGLQARIAGRDLFVPADRIASLEAGRVQLSGETLNLARFQRRAGEVLLRQDVLGRQLVDVESAQLVTAQEIELMCVEGWWRVVAVDTSFRARLRRLLPGPLAARIRPGQLLDWTQVEPFVGHVPTARLRLSHRKLARLHPAQIADLVEAASHDEGEEIIKAVSQDRELEADVFEELDDEHQLEFIRERSDSQVAAVLSRMASDDAADLIAELDQERREPVLTLLPAKQQRQIRTLLGYNPSTAGGMMSTEFLALPESTAVADAIDRIRESAIAPEALSTIYASGGDGELVGSVPVVALLRADPGATLADVLQREPLSVHTDADLPEVARLMTDYNLTTLPVVDEHQRMVGLITVDDVLEQMLPSGWRRRYGLARR
jgi:CBS domain-containing protein